LLYYAVQGTFSFMSGTANSAMTEKAGNLLGNRTASEQRNERIQLLAVGTTILMLSLARWRRIVQLSLSNPIIVAGPALALASAAWSQSPGQTIRGAVYISLSTLFCLYLLDRFEPDELFRLLMFAGTAAAVLSLAVVIAAPQYGVQARALGDSAWQGIFSQKNACGFMLTFFITPALFVSKATVSRKVRFAYIGLLLGLIVMTQSRGAWGVCALVLGFRVALAVGRRLRWSDTIFVATTVLVTLALGLAIVIPYAPTLLTLVGKDATMTGRTEIWAACLASIAKRPWLGYGYNAFWLGMEGESYQVSLRVNMLGINYSENGVLDLLLQLGLGGRLLLLIMYARSLGRIVSTWRQSRSDVAGWCLSIFFLEVITNLEGGRILFPNSLDWTLFVIASVYCLPAYQKLRRFSQPIVRQPVTNWSYQQGSHAAARLNAGVAR
jgi:exopolysaccharide production protein ExoQ